MDIKHTGAPGVRPEQATTHGVERQGKGRADSATPAGSQGTADLVTLTDTARQLLAGSGADAPFDRARVEALREAIANGSYRPDAERTAAALAQLEDKL